MKHKVGDRVRIKDIDWYNANKDEDGNIPLIDHTNSNYNFIKIMRGLCGKVMTISSVNSYYYDMVEDNGEYFWTDEMIEGLVEEEIIDIDDFQDDNEIIDVIDEYVHRLKNNECQINLPEGYQFTDENGNVINATKIVLEKKKKEYPKTYEECCKVMNYCCNPVATKTTHKEELIRKFQFLLLYRDAYWKIAGEEMGLGKPWEPDWNHLSDKWVLFYTSNRVGFQVAQTRHSVFAFPTEEMRDAFYENFKVEIEICKELL